MQYQYPYRQYTYQKDLRKTAGQLRKPKQL